MIPLVSIVIPFYNNLHWLEEALESVYLQTYTNYEILVINDGSELDDEQFLRDHQSRIRYFKTENFGPAHARNYGIEKSNGKYIAFLDSDDLWLPNKLSEQVSFMEVNNLVWTHTGYTFFNDSTNKELSKVNIDGFEGMVFYKSLCSSPVATPCVMIKRSILEKNVSFRFEENMRFGQDGYFWLAISTKFPLSALNKPLTKVRVRGDNAALKARVYLQVKSQIWRALNKQEIFVNSRIKIPFLVKSSYILSSISFKIIYFIEKLIKPSPFLVEFLSKILYMPSYILLRIQKFINNYNVQK